MNDRKKDGHHHYLQSKAQLYNLPNSSKLMALHTATGCCGFPLELGYFYTVAVLFFFSLRVEESHPTPQDVIFTPGT